MATTLSPHPSPRPEADRPGPITEALRQVTARLRLQRWIRHAARGAWIGLGVGLVAVALSDFHWLPDVLPLEAVIPIALLLGVAGGTATAFLRPISPMQAARLAEARLGLKERLSSALEFEKDELKKGEHAPHAFPPDTLLLRRLQSEDAAAYARSLNAVEAVPLRWPWEAKALLGGLAVLALALLLPSLPVFTPPGVLAERQVVHKTGDKMQKTARLIQKQAAGQHLDGTRRVAQNMQKLGQKLSGGKMDKKQAMVQINKLSKQIREEQQKMALKNSGSGAGSKSLAQAGQQMAQALAGSQGSAGTSGKQAGGGQKAGGGGKNGQKAGNPGGAGGKKGNSDKFQGFNVPGVNTPKPGASAPGAQKTPATPEMQKAAQAMQQNDAQGLSQQLRQMADRTGTLSPDQQAQAAKDLQKLADALQNASMPETQKHAQAAADAMKRGDKQAAASEMRKAADAADREAREQADREAMSDAGDQTEGMENEMAGANSPGDIQDDSGQPGQGQGKGKGKGQGKGQGGEGEGEPANMPGANGKVGSGKGNGGSGGGGKAGGKPADTGQGSSPIKHLGKMDPNAPKGGKLYFGKPLNAGPSKTGPVRKVGSNPNAVPGQTPSKVPYYDYVAPAKKSAETTMDKEDIPPAYRRDVRKYFNSLTPPPGGGR